MFIPNQTCIITISSTETDVYGQPVASSRVRERCSIVRMKISSVQSPVRADSSASRGAAKELVADVLILLTKNTKAGVDDAIEVAGNRLRITSKQPRFAVTGELDHYEISAAVWS